MIPSQFIPPIRGRFTNAPWQGEFDFGLPVLRIWQYDHNGKSLVFEQFLSESDDIVQIFSSQLIRHRTVAPIYMEWEPDDPEILLYDGNYFYGPERLFICKGLYSVYTDEFCEDSHANEPNYHWYYEYNMLIEYYDTDTIHSLQKGYKMAVLGSLPVNVDKKIHDTIMD